MYRDAGMQGCRETERQRDRETERQRGKDTERKGCRKRDAEVGKKYLDRSLLVLYRQGEAGIYRDRGVDRKREVVREASKGGRGGGAESPSDKKRQMKGKAGTDSSRERAYLGEIL
jgi:hypothetical protein